MSRELSKPSGRKDYDWSHLAARYWPERVDAKCRQDPSLGVAHGCFWRYHPARAYAWELRLQDEIGPDFRIDEPDSGVHRAAFLRDQPMEAEEIRAKVTIHPVTELGEVLALTLRGASFKEGRLLFGDDNPRDVTPLSVSYPH